MKYMNFFVHAQDMNTSAVTANMDIPETIGDFYKQRKRWAQGGTEIWLTNLKKFIFHPIQRRYQMSMFVNSTLSIIWSFFFAITSVMFLGAMLISLFQGNYENIFHGFVISFIFVTFELIAGCMQLITALLLDHNGAKLKYAFFAPLYMLFYWMINPITVVATFVPAMKTILGFGSGTWVSPKRSSLQNKKQKVA